MLPILFQCTQEDTSYLSFLKPIFMGRAQVRLSNSEPSTIAEVAMSAKAKGAKHVISTSTKLLHLLTGRGGSIDDYAGSIFEKYGVEFLFVPPVEHLLTVPHASFVYNRFVSKFLHPEDWLNIPEFSWEMFDPSKVEEYLERFEHATFISADIETVRDDPNRVIDCIGFTAVQVRADRRCFSAFTLVVPFTELFSVIFARKALRTSPPKVFQNGKYDNAYLLRYRCPVTNYAFDTINLFHCWFSELPKDLGFINAFLLRNWQFHKSEGKTGNLEDHYRYNAKDAFTTAMSFLALVSELPPYALKNFTDHEMPLVWPCILAEATGVLGDKQELIKLQAKFQLVLEERLKRIRKLVANPFYNPNSPKQTAKVFEMLGCKDIKGTGKIQMDKAMARHPLNKLILTTIKKHKEDAKMVGNYLDPEKLWNNRVYYALNPHGTDTARLASKESQFWCGLQIQNIPRDRKDIQVKDAFIADPGFFLGEADGEQAEARDTAYLSGDTNLIEAVESSRDFHAANAEKFFGVAYEKIVSPTGDVLDKELRDLAKRPNHGANYNMTPSVLLDTMGIENVVKAKKLLGLPPQWSLLRVCEYLMEQFDKTYPVVRGDYYKKFQREIAETSMLVSPLGWTRFCFGKPDAKGKFAKRDINRYAAHGSQNLNAGVLNLAWRRVFNEVWLPNQQDFKLYAQIHDSIFFAYRQGRIDLARKVQSCMEITIPVKDTYGIERNLLVPVALKGEATRWSQLKKIGRVEA